MRENIVTRIRRDYRLTQKQIADTAGITEQVVLKAEQGLYPTLPPALLDALYQFTGTRKAVLESEYELWIDEAISQVKLPSHLGNQMITDPILFNEWRSTVCGMNHVPDNINAFCKLLKIHPYVIQKYSAGKMKGVPIQLIKRIGQIKGIG